jgi:hypothetical protein
MSPLVVIAIALGKESLAAEAGPPSPLKPASPFPTTVRICGLDPKVTLRIRWFSLSAM